MDDLLSTRQVLNILKVDRITIYRMLQDGRLQGVKIGQQWRFTRSAVERLIGGAMPQPELPQPETNAIFPTHCVQTIQDLFSEVGQISALIVDPDGEPLTEVSHPCRFCQIIRQNQGGQQACRASWKEFTRHSTSGSRYFTCHAGIQYISAPILDQEKLVGHFLAGEFYWQTPDPQEEAGRIQRLASTYFFPVETLQQAARTVPVIPPEQQSRVETWPATAARAVQSILTERSMFMERLQQIANLTQIH
ncbi:MAG TPA: PocR ligand-binding domain-containing protein [Anaerolineaceae bacterium]|jgi:excisionase family DNA binding protein